MLPQNAQKRDPHQGVENACPFSSIYKLNAVQSPRLASGARSAMQAPPDVQALSAVRLPFEQSRSFAFCAFCAACWAFSPSEHITSATAARSRPLLLARLLAFALLCSVLGSCHLCSARTFWKYLVARSHPACSLPQCKVSPRKSCETHAFHAAL